MFRYRLTYKYQGIIYRASAVDHLSSTVRVLPMTYRLWPYDVSVRDGTVADVSLNDGKNVGE